MPQRSPFEGDANPARRDFLLRGTAGLAGAAGLAATGWPLPGLAQAQAVSPLTFAFWPWGSEIVQQGATRFTQESGVPVNLSPIPGDYAAVLETQLAAKAPLDMFYAQRGQASRWYAAGWIRPIDDMPGLADIQKQMFPGIVDDAHATDGRTLGLTYYNGGPFALFRNEKMLGEAGFQGTANAADYPQDWATVEKQAREIKKKGLSEHPLLMPWYNAWTGLPWALIAQCFAEGERFVDDELRATFNADTPLAKVLTDWKRWWDDELVQRAVLTWSGTETSSSWMKGQHAFHLNIDYYSFNYNDPAKSQIAAYSSYNPVVPGATHDTVLVGHALLCMSTRKRNDAEQAALWELMKYFGYRDKAGQLTTHKNWIAKANLEVPFPELYRDPDSRAAIMKWMYPPQAEQVYQWLFQGREKAVAAHILKAPWYQEWDTAMHEMIAQDLLIKGSKTPAQVATELRARWDALYKKYAKILKRS